MLPTLVDIPVSPKLMTCLSLGHSGEIKMYSKVFDVILNEHDDIREYVCDIRNSLNTV